jgi:ribonuclease-3
MTEPSPSPAQAAGYSFREPSLLREAMTHASSANVRLESNERMEFLGDAVLGLVICEHLYRTLPGLAEGDLTKIKSAVVSRRTCARISREHQLIDMLDLGKGMSGRRGVPSSVAAAVLESLVAAVYLDGGLEAARSLVLRLMQPVIDEAAGNAHQHNYKSVLQQLAQRHLPSNPSYVLLDEKGPDHAKAFEVSVQLCGRTFAPAWANNKKEAEQRAALEALTQLGLAFRDDAEQLQVIDEDHPDAADRLAELTATDAEGHADADDT